MELHIKIDQIMQLCVFSSVATSIYGSNDPPQAAALPDCDSVPQPYPVLLPTSLEWPLEGKELPDPFASQVLSTLLCVSH